MPTQPAADRNLIFGLLALQMDFVSREQLLDAMHAWMLDKHTPLADILCRRGVLSQRRAGVLDALVEEHLARHGDPQASLAALRVEPDLREQLRILATPLDGAHTLPPQAAPAPATSSAGRYRRLREHARGGLGEVLVALDQELGREVALKQIQDRHADAPEARARFLREGQITGNLEHPGVVPVYGLGAYPDGRPYYVMRFVRGESLHDAIARFHRADEPSSLALRGLLDRFIAVCNAVAYAHSRGVIHRDLKPANVMLGEYGETLVVDWGLAKVLPPHPPAPSPTGGRGGDGLAPPSPLVGEGGGGGEGVGTQMGQVVGTPAFMPPEQANGRLDQVGPRSDVFALGATLYSLLTGHAPYEGADALIQAAMAEAVPARQRERSVPAALEAVCARAMMARPEDRYPTAQALAEEVRRWLADEPVAAYREPLPQRLRRWGRRHRSLVSAGLVLLLAGVVGLGGGLWAVGREQARTANALEESQSNLDRAEANLKLARDAVDECFNVAREHPLFQQPRMENARRLLLEKTFHFYKELRERKPDDPTLEGQEAEQFFRVAFIEHTLGRSQDALASYRLARERGLRLVEAHPDVPEYRQALGRTITRLGLLLRDLGDLDAAAREHRQALAIQAPLAANYPDVARYQNDLAATHNNLGNVLKSQGRHQEALAEFRRALTIRTQVVKDHPDNPGFRNDLASIHNNLGGVLSDLGRDAEAIGQFGRAISIRVRLVEAHPAEARFAHDLAMAHNGRGVVLWARGRRHEAVRDYRAALGHQASLVQLNPDVPDYRLSLGLTHNNLGVVLGQLGQVAASGQVFRRGCEILSELAEAHPEVPDYQAKQVLIHNNLRDMLENAGRISEGLVVSRQVVDIHARLARTFPNEPRHRYHQARALTALGQLRSDLGQGEQGLPEAQRAVDLAAQLTRAHPGDRQYRQALSDAHHCRGLLLFRLGRRKEALDAYRQARDVQQRLVKDYPTVPEYRNELAVICSNLGSQLAVAGQVRQALSEYTLALDLRLRLMKEQPKLAGLSHGLALAHYNRGWALEQLDRKTEALAEFRAARDLRVRLAREGPLTLRHRYELAETHNALGSLLAELNRPADSLSDLDQGVAQAQQLRRLDPGNPRALSLLLRALSERAAVRTRLGRRREADADWERALKEDPASRHSWLRIQRADALARAGEHRRAAALAEEESRLTLPAGLRYNLACVQALCAAASARDSSRPLPERERRAEVLARQAVASLRGAAAAGYFAPADNVTQLDRDDDLAFLRDRSDYRSFQKKLKPPKAPR